MIIKISNLKQDKESESSQSFESFKVISIDKRSVPAKRDAEQNKLGGKK